MILPQEIQERLMAFLEAVPKTVEQIKFKYCGSDGERQVTSVDIRDGMDIKLTIGTKADCQMYDLCFDIVEEHSDGWECEDGGQGTLTISIPDKKIKIDHAIYVMSTEDSSDEVEF